jgi:uncharacterized protein (TIGR02301 family)
MRHRRPDGRPAHRFPAAIGVGLTALLAAGTAGPGQAAKAPAQPPPAAAVPARLPDQRQKLTELSYVLGQSHALRRACLGPSDRLWYDRMQRLLLVEAPDKAFRQVLVERFNAGFLAAGAEYPRCTPDSRAAARDAAERGKALADRMAAGTPAGRTSGGGGGD